MTLSLYGKKTDDFDKTAEGFITILKDYPADDVEESFKHYLKSEREFPAPCDIIRIIEGGVKKDGFYYQQLMKRKGSLTEDEIYYIKQYEIQTLEA